MRGWLAIVALAACEPPTPPDRPSWQVDVMPLFAANCVRCHAYPFRGDGSTALRLDSFDDTELADGNVATGASKSALQIFRHTHGIALLRNERIMPPDRPLDDYELAVVRNWADQGTGDHAIRGPGHPDNHAPAITLTEVMRSATSVTFSYVVTDADRDLVVAAVIGPRYKLNQLELEAVIGNATTGHGVFTWDTTAVPPGDYTLKAKLDDGADVDGPQGNDDFIVQDLGTVSLP
jgi:hypothetical protein